MSGILESFFIKIGSSLINFILFLINSLNLHNSNSEFKDVKSSNKSEVNEFNNSNIGNNNGNSSNNKFGSKFNMNYFKSLFFKENIKEESIFRNLDDGYFSSNKPKRNFFSIFNRSNKSNSYNNSKYSMFRDSLSSSSKKDSYKKDVLNEVTYGDFVFNLRYLSKFGVYFILVLLFIICLISYFISFEIGLSILIILILLFLAILFIPKIKKQNEVISFSSELPYALLQLATELKSGKSLFNSLESVVDADYGVLSLEFSRVLEEIKYGETTEDAFVNLESRIDSEALSRVIREILSTLRIGGNLANSLMIISEDINFEMRMKLKDYAQRLNAFIMIYTFVVILAPVVLLTLLLAASTVMGDIVPGDFLLILYGVFFPMLIVFLAFVIKKLEPKI